MKKFVCILLAIVLVLSLCACGQTTESTTEEPKEEVPEEIQEEVVEETPVEETQPEEEPEENEEPEEEPEVNEDDLIDDASWDALEQLGQIETEDGIFYVTLTVPADYIGETTQEKLDSNVGETYTSAILNEDGSVTYKMTKKQHKTMLDSMAELFDEALEEFVTSGEYTFTEITHNEDFTVFDVTLSTTSVGFTESFMVLAFYMYGGMYNVFTGNSGVNIEVNYYGPDGTLLQTGNSANASE